KSKTGVDFLFNDKVLANAKPVTVNMKNVSLREALEACLSGQPFEFVIDESTVLIKRKPEMRDNSTPIVQQRDLIGWIKSSNGEPLSDVTVRNVNSGYATVSDEKGRFVVPEVNRGDELAFSLLGYATRRIVVRSEEHTSELQSRENLVCRLLL